MQPEFPILLVDNLSWDLNQDTIDFWLETDIYRAYCFDKKEKDLYYNNYLSSKRFVDSNGNVFVLRTRIPQKDFLQLIGWREKQQLVFEFTTEILSFNEVENYLLNKVKQMGNLEENEDWLNAIKKAKTIKELLRV